MTAAREANWIPAASDLSEPRPHCRRLLLPLACDRRCVLAVLRILAVELDAVIQHERNIFMEFLDGRVAATQ